MITNILSKVVGTRNERLIKKMRKIVERINAYEPELALLSDEDLRAKTGQFRQRLQEGVMLNALLPEVFAVVREVSKRVLGLRHFDVQMIGGIVLHDGKIAEMRTGEGKTLVATLPAYLNALTNKSVHIVTVNDYLAKRDAEWMRPIYEFLGLTVGINLPDMPPEIKRLAYAADITYGTNNEFGFDYLRDNMVFRLEDKVQRGLSYAIVDEVDSILIDEARTPLIISGPAEESSELYIKINAMVPSLTKQVTENGPGDYTVDEKTKQAYLTEEGHQHIEKIMADAGLIKSGESLYDVTHITLMHHLTAALRAHAIYKRDVDYIVKDNQIIIVDEHTGRLMQGRRWGDGLHQAVEAKENVAIQSENQTLATITFQNYFRLYEKLAGMTGTADTEAYEFQQIYGLEVVVMPTNKPIVRQDKTDKIYININGKFKAIIHDIKDRSSKGQPILVGTASIDTSEYLSGLLTKEKIPHQVLNAKYHEVEAKIIAQAGRPGTVTIATNMAGRGTDIVLGGNLQAEIGELENPTPEEIEQVKKVWQERHAVALKAGGLHVLGTERNESRRIDNQLRGRSGRQGDPGSSEFYLSLQDNLMRIFASDRVTAIMRTLGLGEDDVIQSRMVSKQIENAQRKVEGHNFDIRKQLLEFDDVANDQRKVVYQQRNELMAEQDISEALSEIRTSVMESVINERIPLQSLEEQWDAEGLQQQLARDFSLHLPIKNWLDEDESVHEEVLRKRIIEAAENAYKEKLAQIDPAILRNIEKSIMLQSLDTHWKEHLAAMDHLRKGIHLRGYAQKNPKQEYKRESFEMFSQMLQSIKYDVISALSHVQVQSEQDTAMIEQQRQQQEAMLGKLQYQHAESNSIQLQAIEKPFTSTENKVGRNDPCPCGSGKKYKQCHGKLG